MKLGILGTGKIVQEFLPWLVEHTPFTVQAICSTPRSAELAQSLCGQYGVPQHTTNFLELLQANMSLWKSPWPPRRHRPKNW